VLMELRSEQNGEKCGVGVTFGARSQLFVICFKLTIDGSIEKCLIYSAIGKSAESDFGKRRYQGSVNNLRKR
jgi:hypothetical protein